MELNLGNLLRCPAGTPGTADKIFEMKQIYELEARQNELATMSKQSAPELMQTFINGYGHTTRALVQLEWELTQARKYQEERKAVVYLEVAPEYLQKHGLVRAANPSGSEDQRKAVLARDDEYKALSDRVSMIEAAVEFLKTKAKGFEMSYQVAKKVYDSLGANNVLAYAPHKTEGAGTYVDMDEPPTKFAIGKPKY